jgi:glycosyltransferase involved in cell wall biosynthesis
VAFALTGDVRQNSRALRQLRALADRGLSVAVLTMRGANPDRALGLPGVHLVERDDALGGGPAFYVRNHIALVRDASRVQARVYHASDLYALPAMAKAARPRAALTYDARECYPHVFGTVGKPAMRLFWHLLERRYARRADAAFTVSQSIARHMAEAYGIAPPALLPNADPVSAAPPDRHLLHHRLGLPKGAPVVLYQGALTPRRGLDRLVAAWRSASPLCPNAHLVFLGRGPMQAELESAAAGLERVHFGGAFRPDEAASLTASASIGVTLLDDVCLNHRYALPNKLFAYLGAGVPVVASDLPEMRRVLGGPPPAGLLVPPGSTDDLARALVTLLRDADLRARLGAAAPAILETTDANGALHRFADTLAALAQRRS